MQKDEQIKHMTERFLRWELPADFNPDAGISFDPVYNLGTEHQGRHEPTGTNLLSYTQAEAMVRHMVDGISALTAAAPDENDPWVQLGFYKEKLEQAERDRDEWKERAMTLRLSTPTAAAPDREHQWYKCPQPCETMHCIYCDGGLAFCTICKKGEGELAESCPGPAAPDERGQIVAWLRQQDGEGEGLFQKRNLSFQIAAKEFADAIERGDHLPRPGGEVPEDHPLARMVALDEEMGLYDEARDAIHPRRRTLMHFQIYRDEAKEWRWQLRSGNNEIIATSESYTTKRNVLRAVSKLANAMMNLEDIPIIERLR